MKANTIRTLAMRNIGHPDESQTQTGDMRVCLAAIMNYWATQTMGSRMEFGLFRTQDEASEWLGGKSQSEVNLLDSLFDSLDTSNMVD